MSVTQRDSNHKGVPTQMLSNAIHPSRFQDLVRTSEPNLGRFFSIQTHSECLASVAICPGSSWGTYACTCAMLLMLFPVRKIPYVAHNSCSVCSQIGLGLPSPVLDVAGGVCCLVLVMRSIVSLCAFLISRFISVCAHPHSFPQTPTQLHPSSV